MHLSRQTPVSTTMQEPAARQFRGVYEADATRPPPPPAKARAVEVFDSKGRRVAWGWAVEDLAGDIGDQSWSWLDQRDKPEVPRPELKIVPRSAHALR